jgi:ssRNA-specific RNase YbeY (16S rRNA maturation enzyme)
VVAGTARKLPSARGRSGPASATGGPSVGPYPSLSRCRVPGCEVRPVILERRKTKELSRLALARFANLAQRATGLRGEVNILLTGDAEMQRLNRQFRRKDKPTDVLSFSNLWPNGTPKSVPWKALLMEDLSDPDEAAGYLNEARKDSPAAYKRALQNVAKARRANAAGPRERVPASTPAGGDIAISLSAARAQAAALGHGLLTEVKVLILHGMLHLAGHDHERDHGEMLRLEQKLRGELHLTDGLIERTLAPRSVTRKPTRKPTGKPTGGTSARARRP